MTKKLNLKVNNVRIALNDEQDLVGAVAKKLKVNKETISEIKVLRRAVDARRKSNISIIYHVSLSISDGAKNKNRLLRDNDITEFRVAQEESLKYGGAELDERPIVVGAGPAGLLAAYWLAKHGYRPLLLERGKALPERIKDVSRFWGGGAFDEESNVQFGEGGAGTFSDGKLTTRVNDPIMQKILKLFVDCGAPETILTEQKPHVGTDKLRAMVAKITAQIRSLGGEVRFQSQLTDLKIKNNQVCGVVINHSEQLNSNVVILACGHSARDTYELLHKRAVAMEAKTFSIGLRIEHPQTTIDQAQYGEFAGHPLLGVADYALVHHEPTTKRSAYSFCMCPGGVVVASSSEKGGVVTNGMSMHSRNSGLANSAVVVNVGPGDFDNNPLGGVEFQRYYERLAYITGGANYMAPGQSVESFIRNTSPTWSNDLKPTYRPGIKLSALELLLPNMVSTTLKAGLIAFDSKIKGFAGPQGFLTGIETRTSAPLRIVRNTESYESISHMGLYPTGEGAGYAGGIMSAALDGYKVASGVIKKFKPLQ
ncbi:MAG TPA: NAD(P)/FAD-dependent oxidoreductase [Candidatus Avacidaminococcus intestinavium]|uniref:NAD(P)/FAD-dependent oxidoreductase n=1 Tax=Candidatus Avacidaminococcus intestinavium TaxID=2840684 RepID=A0A9D1MNP4_9FIRM|nr:NAD(P)/FAD-dependent oxidoreductase [Candidatus Avacidaminococcus intestinavium]